VSTGSTVTLIPGANPAPGMGVVVDPPRPPRPLTAVDKLDARAAMLTRAGRGDYWRWLAHVHTAAACTRPVRLAGTVHTINTATGELVESRRTADMPDAVIYKACGNRRAAVCPACAEVYRADAYQLVLAGLRGGKGIPDSVAGHPAVFATLTAPSFGLVHSQRRRHPTAAARACRPRRTPETCRHGRDLTCGRTHTDDDPQLGRPLCPHCYEAAGLRVGDVDFLRRRLKVERSVSDVDGHLVLTTPKTHHAREVPMPAFVAAMLADTTHGRSADSPLFTSPVGALLRGNNFRRRSFDRAAASIGLPGLTPHELRHTAASLAVSAGANVKAVQRMLGHASAAMTLDVYAGLFGDDLDLVADRLDATARAAAADQVRTDDPDADDNQGLAGDRRGSDLG
jgi:hypothetical protein